MVLIHILGLLDLFAAVTLLGGHFGIFHFVLLYTAIYLITKLFFFRNWMSIIDVLAALYAIYLFFAGSGTGITWFFMIWFAYKTAVWLFFTLTN
jgi:hypothetical protein